MARGSRSSDRLVAEGIGAVYFRVRNYPHIGSASTLATWVSALVLFATVLISLAHKGRSDATALIKDALHSMQPVLLLMRCCRAPAIASGDGPRTRRRADRGREASAGFRSGPARTSARAAWQRTSA